MRRGTGSARRAIVSVSEPRPAESWRWGGEGWRERSVPGSLLGVTVGVADAEATRDRWQEVAGGPVPVEFVDDPAQPGIVRIDLDLNGSRVSIDPSAI